MHYAILLPCRHHIFLGVTSFMFVQTLQDDYVIDLHKVQVSFLTLFLVAKEMERRKCVIYKQKLTLYLALLDKVLLQHYEV